MSSDVNTQFCRIYLRETHKDVKKAIPGVNLRKAAWVHNTGGGDSWEFQTVEREGVEKFYWYGGAYNAYEARAKGWSAYLSKFFPHLDSEA